MPRFGLRPQRCQSRSPSPASCHSWTKRSKRTFTRESLLSERASVVLAFRLLLHPRRLEASVRWLERQEMRCARPGLIEHASHKPPRRRARLHALANICAGGNAASFKLHVHVRAGHNLRSRRQYRQHAHAGCLQRSCDQRTSGGSHRGRRRPRRPCSKRLAVNICPVDRPDSDDSHKESTRH